MAFVDDDVLERIAARARESRDREASARSSAAALGLMLDLFGIVLQAGPGADLDRLERDVLDVVRKAARTATRGELVEMLRPDLDVGVRAVALGELARRAVTTPPRVAH